MLKRQQGKIVTKRMVKQRASLAETMLEWAKQWHPTKNGDLTPNDVTSGGFKPVWWLCDKCGHKWLASPNNCRKVGGCPWCSDSVLKTGVNDLATLYPQLLTEWDYKKNKDLNSKNILPGSGQTAWWKCSKCDYEWKTYVRSRTQGRGCLHCIRKKKSKDQMYCDFWF